MSSNLGEFGIVPIVPITLVGTAVANAVVNARHAVAVDKLQERFQKHLDIDEVSLEYIRNIILRIQSAGTRVAVTSGIQPGTQEFENRLKQELVNEMLYKSYCNADVYVPMGPFDRPGTPRGIWATFDRGGMVQSPLGIPLDAGPIWATGCKNAQDDFRIAFAQKYKGGVKFERLKIQKIDIGTISLLLKIGLSIFMAVLLFMSTRIQKKVIKLQPKKRKVKKKPKPKKKKIIRRIIRRVKKKPPIK